MKGIETFVFEHPLLGRLMGIRRNEDVVQFRGIPYGRIPLRFRQAVLVDALLPAERDCTNYSYACPQIEQALEPFGGPVPGESLRSYDEFSCLNLTITAPTPGTGSLGATKLPVMVYTHGGGFAQGAHYGAVHGKQ